MQRKGNASLIASAALGITLGWLAKNYVSNQQQLEEHRSVLKKAKDFEQKVYEDGKKRLEVIQGIKQEVNSEITN